MIRATEAKKISSVANGELEETLERIGKLIEQEAKKGIEFLNYDNFPAILTDIIKEKLAEAGYTVYTYEGKLQITIKWDGDIF